MSKHDAEVRRLVAIMFTDIVGYTALMGRDEAAGRKVRERHEAVVRPLVKRYHGQWLEERGDESLSVFPSALDAVNCALAIQQELAADADLKIRIGLHSADVTFEHGRVVGDGVNVASRVRALAEPGGTCITAEVWQTVRNQLNVKFTSLGERELKHVSRPVVVYSVSGTALEPGRLPRSARVNGRPSSFGWWVAAAAAVGLVAGFVALWWITELERGEATTTSTPAATIAPGKSIAVLPFDNISADPADAYIADGIHDEILAQLSRIRELKVISRTSVMSYRRKERPSLPEIADKLGVANILEGSVRLAGNRVRITTQLIEARSDAHLWVEIYDRELTAANIFSIQSDVANAVANALRAALSSDEHKALAAVPTKDTAALDAYFRGKRHMEKRTTAALAEAVDDFNRSIEHDPNFALAYVGLADSYMLQIGYGSQSRDEMLERAQAAAANALALDGRLAEAYASLGQIERERGNYEASEAAYQHSLEMNSNYVTAYHWYSILLGGLLDRREEALELIKKAAELDPRSPIILINVGVSYASVGRFDESLKWYRKSIEVDPDFANGYLWIGIHYWEVEGRLATAVEWFRKSVSIDPGAVSIAYLAWLFLDLGDLDRAKYWAEKSMELAPESFLPNFVMQLLQLYRGDLTTALDYGRRAFGAEDSEAIWFSSFRPTLMDALSAGRYGEARAAVEELAPELLNEPSPRIDIRNYRAAIDLALILSRLGERERAHQLLQDSLQFIRRIPRLGDYGHGVADVQIYALQGDPQKALGALRQAIDEGWRNTWWYSLKFDPSLESLRKEAEFQAMVREIESDMADQREQVREMERNGELAPIPEMIPVAQ